MERDFTIKADKDKVIYGSIRGSLKKPAIIIVHGLGSSPTEALYYNAARNFEQHGFLVVRFNLYHWKKGARKLNECTLKTHGRDIDEVISYLRTQGSKKIFVIGHSYGGPSIMHSEKQDFDGVILWDSSINSVKNYFLKTKFIPDINGRLFNVGYDMVIPEAMVQESKQLDVYKLIKNITAPVLVIAADMGILVNGAKKMYHCANEPKDFAVIKDASHNFEEDKAQEKL